MLKTAPRAKKRSFDPADPAQVAAVTGDWKILNRLSCRAQIEAEIAARDQNPPAPKAGGRTPSPDVEKEPEAPLAGKSQAADDLLEKDPPAPGLPVWMPAGEDLEKMPGELRQAVAEIVHPAYQELVLDAPTGLEKGLGASIVYLLWLEVLDQFDLKQEYCSMELGLGLEGNRAPAIEQYLKLLGAKLRLGNFLIRLRELRRK